MARYVPDNEITQQFLNNQGLGQDVEDGVSYVKKAARVKIIADRYTRGFQKVDRNGPNDAYHHEDTSQAGSSNKAHRREIGREVPASIWSTEYKSQAPGEQNVNKAHREQTDGSFLTNDSHRAEEGYSSELANQRTSQIFTKDRISIIDLDHIPTEDDAKKFYSYLTLPFVPREVNYTMDSNFVGIATIGRNNPHYHFTGSEDTIEFRVDWRSDVSHREDVIMSCRWLESLTKGDGYNDLPHRVKLIWGANDLLFRDDIFLLVKAPYRLKEFVDSYKEPGTGEIKRVGLLPQQAYQTLTFKRITSRNRTTREIMGSYNNIKTPQSI